MCGGAGQVQIRNPAGQWLTSQAPPATAALNVSPQQLITKLSGQKILVRWWGQQPAIGFTVARIYDSISGWGPVIAIPPYSGDPVVNSRVVNNIDTLGADGLFMRARPYQVTGGFSSDFMFELVSVSSGTVVASYRSELAQIIPSTSSCQFKNGDRLHVYASYTRIGTSNIAPYENRVWATIYKAGVGWQQSIRIGSFVGDTSGISVHCVGSAARVIWDEKNNSFLQSKFADWTASQGWQQPQVFSSVYSSIDSINPPVRQAYGDDGSAFIAWNESQVDPAGPYQTITTFYPSGNTATTNYSIVPRISDLVTGDTLWTPLVGLPLYQITSNNLKGIGAVAFNPTTKRYVTLISETSAQGNTGPSYFADYSRAEGWSSTWPVPAGFTPKRIHFNVAGKGVAIGDIGGNTYVSDWR